MERIMSTRVLHLGATEYVEASITADVSLDAQTVTLSVDGGTTWLASTWLGIAGLTRSARTSSPVVVSTSLPTRGVHTLLARVVDGTETTIVKCGGISVR
jgi:hypothetical protein